MAKVVLIVFGLIMVILGSGCASLRSPNPLEEGCRKNQARDCYQLGYEHFHNKTSKDIELAKKYYTKSCNLDLQWACVALGTMHEAGLGYPRNFEIAVDAYQKACVKDIKYCVYYARMLDRGVGVQRNRPEAFRLFVESCDAIDPNDPLYNISQLESCHFAGDYFKNGIETTIDYSRAVEMFKKSCDLQNGQGCALLGAMYSSGLGVPKDPRRAFDLANNSCLQGEGLGCRGVGLYYERGEGNQHPNLEQAIHYFEMACDRQDLLACNYLGTKLIIGQEISQDIPKGLKMLESGCALDYHEACDQLAFLYRDGNYFPKNAEKAFAYFTHSCELGSVLGCDNLAYQYWDGRGVTKDISLTMKYAEKSCGMNSPQSCVSWAYFLVHAPESRRDYLKASELLAESCRQKFALACANLVSLYEDGLGVPKDHARAVEFLELACDYGDGESCTELKKNKK